MEPKHEEPEALTSIPGTKIHPATSEHFAKVFTDLLARLRSLFLSNDSSPSVPASHIMRIYNPNGTFTEQEISPLTNPRSSQTGEGIATHIEILEHRHNY